MLKYNRFFPNLLPDYHLSGGLTGIAFLYFGVDILKNPNPLKQLLKEGKPALGGWITLEGALKTEVFAKGGFDWMTIDLQHGALTLESARPLITAIEASGSSPLVRVPWNEPSIIMRALDAGAYGIIVPLVNSAEEAAAAVPAMKYPPEGIRSSGPWRAGISGVQNYQSWINNELVLMVMIETKQAVENVDAILSVPGIDGVYVGPSDLSLAYGLSPAPDQTDKEWNAALDSILAACKKYNVVPGIAGNAKVAVKRLSQGFRFLEVSRDTTVLERGAREDVELLKSNMS